MSGTHEGKFFDFEPTGRSFHVRQVRMLRPSVYKCQNSVRAEKSPVFAARTLILTPAGSWLPGRGPHQTS
jgi:hypothetical protein